MPGLENEEEEEEEPWRRYRKTGLLLFPGELV
jgi:hypothetical protein